MRTFLVAVLLAGTGFSFTSANAGALPLTSDQAQRLAVERSRQLAAQDYAAAAARDMAVAAGQLPDPVLTAGIDNLPVNGPDRFSLTRDFMTMRRVGVMQEITAADKRQARSERYQREAEKSLAEKSTLIASIQRDTALAWLERYYAEAMAAVVEEQGEQARLELQAAEGAFRAGRGSQAELIAARSAVIAFENRLSESQQRVRRAKAMLVRWAGPAAEGPLAGTPAHDTLRPDLATLESRLAHHPQIAVLDKQQQIAAAEAKLAQANKRADWSIEVMYSQRGPAYSNMVSVGVSIPLQWDQKNRQDRELSAKLGMVEQARAERDEMLRAHAAETRVMADEWQTGRERLARYERELIPLAQDRTRAVIASYRGGKSALAEVLAARSNEIEVRMQALQLNLDTARLWAQLNYLFPADDLSIHSSIHGNTEPK